ncbi:hypothetical protein CKG00_09635 [Morganella morganii]|uniref:MORN repeat variant n=1 Tax=Morganella morganii TaxID=582 RepID=A0A433ZWX9_MORMO|nr:hypothetical protein [Morganella morganii]RUT66616.1 hypothetical protein CKG00_09635 [Morganella morganii]
MKQCNIFLSPLMILTAGTVFASPVQDNNTVSARSIVYKDNIAYQRADQPFTGSAVEYCIRDENNQKIIMENTEHYYEFSDGMMTGKTTDYDCHSGLITDVRHYKNNKKNGLSISYAWPGVPYDITWYDNGYISPAPENKRLTPDDFPPVYFQKSDNTINVNTLASLDDLFYQIKQTPFTGMTAEYCIIYDDNGNKSEDKTKISLTSGYKNGLKDGKETRYNCGDGKVSGYTDYQQGMKNGIQMLFQTDGSVRNKIMYENDKKHGDAEYYTDNILTKKEHYKNGVLDGRSFSYNKYGDVTSFHDYQDGVYHGFYFVNNYMTKYMMSERNNRRHGWTYSYDKDGNATNKTCSVPDKKNITDENCAGMPLPPEKITPVNR